MAERRPLVIVDGTPRELPSGDTTPVAGHAHGNITTDGKVGTVSGIPLITGASGTVQAGSFGSTAGTFCAGNDSRLSDAREWTASTVTQAEAEAGTATTRRAWTAQRVAQAIAAWWTASAAKSKLDGIATGATANATDAQLRDRSTHTGTQAVSTITGLGGAATLNVGTAAGTVCAGNDARLSDARTPTSHTHGNITNAGAIGSTSGVPLITGTSGVIQAGSFGTTAGTFCQGNDSRLSDARTPTAHKSSHATGQADALTPADIGAATAGHDHAGVYDPAGTASSAVGTHESTYTHSLIATALQPADIDDASIADDKLWSAAKISSELGDIASALDALNGESI